jgi:hypothetical protein
MISMSEYDLVRKLREIARKRGKSVEELVAEYENYRESESYSNDEDKYEDNDSQFFMIHDFVGDAQRVTQEHHAQQLQREYESLKAVHDYSEKLEALQEHMEMERKAEGYDESNLEGKTQSGFEIEVNDALHDLDLSSEEVSLYVESSSSETNPEVNSSESGTDISSELGELGETGVSAFGDGSISSGVDGGNGSVGSMGSTSSTAGSGQSAGSQGGSSSGGTSSGGSGGSGGAK